MKRLFLILFLIPFISCCQTNSEFILQHTIAIEFNKEKCITKNDCFFLELDTTNFSVTMFFSFRKNEKKDALETMDISGFYYGSDLNNYKNETDNSYIVLWKRESEYTPSFYAYYLKNGKIVKVGVWRIAEPCDNCDAWDYSVEDIRIHQKNNEIEFLFLKETSFVVIRDNDYDDWGTFKAGELIISFNIVDKTLKLIEKHK